MATTTEDKAALRNLKEEGTPVDATQVELILAQIESLPTLSQIAVQLLELTSDERTGARDLVRLIESDQSLAARVLAVARRANRGADAQTVERAVQVLGFHAVRNLTLSVEVFETLARQGKEGARRFDREGFWKHSLAVACAARLLAEAVAEAKNPKGYGPIQPEDAFCCGLLHDIGKIVLAGFFPKAYERVIEQSEALLLSLADGEREVFGVDHAMVGRRLAQHWKLPDMVVETIWLHHHPPTALPTQIRYADHVRLVHLANKLARQMCIGCSGSHDLGHEEENFGQAAGLTPKALEQVRAALPEWVESRAQLIGLHALTSREVYEEALRRANAELARVNARLTEANQCLQQRSQCFEALRAFKAALDEPALHENVCRAAVTAAAAVVPDMPVGMIGLSQARSLATLAACNPEPAFPITEPSPQPSHPNNPANTPATPTAQFLPLPAGLIAGLRENSNAEWMRDAPIPRLMQDRLATLLGRPPAAWLVIRFHDVPVGLLALGSNVPPQAQEGLATLADWVASWLGAAESRAQASRLNDELLDMNRRLVVSQATVARMRSLAMVGEMAAGAAHELNNPLAVISGRAQLLARNEVDEHTRRSADVIAEHAHRASAIVTELMEYAKPAPPELSTWSIGALLAELRRDWLDKNILSDQQFQLILSDDLPLVTADAAQMRKLFDEVIRNAVEAMREHPNPRLIVNCRGDVTDEMLVVRVEDNGVGMTAEVLERAMDPFFSQRPAGRGRGLGLSRAARYAEVNRGSIRIASRPQEGTVVLVSIPAASPS